MFDGRWRTSFERACSPSARTSAAPASPPTTSRPSALLMAVGAAIAIGAGALRVGLLLVILTAVPDLLDGAVAKASGTASPSGRVLRLGHRPGAPTRCCSAASPGTSPRSTAATSAMLPLAVLAMSHAHLLRAGQGRVARLRRPRRDHGARRADHPPRLRSALRLAARPVLWVMLVLTMVTAVQRFVKVWRQASAERPAREPSRWQSRRVARPTARARKRAERRHNTKP